MECVVKSDTKTLQHLILDQRAVADENVADGTDNRTYMRQCANGPSYDRFVKMVLPALPESEDCSNLKVIRLFGFEAHEEGADTTYCNYVDYPDRSVDVPGQIRAAFPDAEVSDYAGRRLISWKDSGEVIPGKSFLNSEVRAKCATALKCRLLPITLMIIQLTFYSLTRWRCARALE